MQHNRTENSGRYRAPRRMPGVQHVVVIRDSRALPRARELFPAARLHLWLHHYMPPGSKLFLRLAATAEVLREHGVTVICVSDDHRRAMNGVLGLLGLTDAVSTRTIYNPVDEALVPNGAPVDERKLVFFSSPNKGLKFALDAFQELRRRMPDLLLMAGNPGYKLWALPPASGVVFLAPKPQHEIHAEVRNALCVFHPNFVFPETFGLVLAESKALGTPVLTHDCGAAGEVVGDPQQVLPIGLALRLYEDLLGGLPPRWRRAPARVAGRAGLFDCYAERIRSWRSGARPQVGPDPRFRVSAVARNWQLLLSSSPGSL
jgi:glycosyltransferase involved in cell wall biosynthesis